MTHLNEMRDQRSPKMLEYVFGLRQSFLPTTVRMSFNMTSAFGISCGVAAVSSCFLSGGSGPEVIVHSLKLISFSVSS